MQRGLVDDGNLARIRMVDRTVALRRHHRNSAAAAYLERVDELRGRTI